MNMERNEFYVRGYMQASKQTSTNKKKKTYVCLKLVIHPTNTFGSICSNNFECFDFQCETQYNQTKFMLSIDAQLYSISKFVIKQYIHIDPFASYKQINYK